MVVLQQHSDSATLIKFIFILITITVKYTRSHIDIDTLTLPAFGVFSTTPRLTLERRLGRTIDGWRARTWRSDQWLRALVWNWKTTSPPCSEAGRVSAALSPTPSERRTTRWGVRVRLETLVRQFSREVPSSVYMVVRASCSTFSTERRPDTWPTCSDHRLSDHQYAVISLYDGLEHTLLTAHSLLQDLLLGTHFQPTSGTFTHTHAAFCRHLKTYLFRSPGWLTLITTIYCDIVIL